MDLSFFEKLLSEQDECILDLHTAASIGYEEHVLDIIKKTDNRSVLNLKNSSGWTPLMYAASCTNLKIVGLLLEKGADASLKNNLGHTALILASKCGSTDAVSFLIDNGSAVNDTDHKGWSALSHAAAFGHRSVVQLLIAKGATADIVDKQDGLTPLMLSSAAGHELIVKDLLQLGLNPSSRSKSGETAGSLALKNGHVKVKNLVDAHVCSRKNYNLPHPKLGDRSTQSDLQMLLKELKLSKYYYVFESHGIDLNMFWMLSEEDLKEIGIQLLGPRKRMCIAISEWYQNNVSRVNSDDLAFSSRLLFENQKLRQKKEELESALKHKVELRNSAEYNLNEAIKALKIFSDTVQRTMTYTVLLQDKLKQSHINLKKLLCCTSEVNWPKFKIDLVLPLMDGMEKLMDDIHHHTLAMQQTNFMK